jgi:hypothetical protein
VAKSRFYPLPREIKRRSETSLVGCTRFRDSHLGVDIYLRLTTPRDLATDKQEHGSSEHDRLDSESLPPP